MRDKPDETDEPVTGQPDETDEPVTGQPVTGVLTGQVQMVPGGGTPLLTCANPQCRVSEFVPHSSKAQDQKCPACYGHAA